MIEKYMIFRQQNLKGKEVKEAVRTMLRIAAIVLLVALVATSAMAVNWPNSKRDASNTSLVPTSVVAKPAVKTGWLQPVVGDGSPSGFVIDPDGNIIVQAQNGTLSKVDPSGNIIWTSPVNLGGGCWGAPALAPDGTIYACGWADGNLHAIDPSTGNEKPGWPCILPGGGGTDTSPVVSADGTRVYAHQTGSDTVYCVDPVGGVAPVPVTDEMVTLTGTDPVALANSPVNEPSLVVTDITGTITYSIDVDYTFTAPNLIARTPGSSIGDGDTVLVDYTYNIPAPAVVWTYAGIGWGYGDPILTTIIDGGTPKNLYIIGCIPPSATDPSVFALRDDGASATLLWSAVAAYHWSNPILSLDGTKVYQGNFWDWGPDTLFCFDVATGAEKWRLQTGGNHFQPPSLGPDGTIYMGSHNGNTFAIQDNGTSASVKWMLPGVGGETLAPTVLTTSPHTILYSLDQFNMLRCIRDRGTYGEVLWEFTATLPPPPWSPCPVPVPGKTPPIVADDGTLYFQRSDQILEALEPGYAVPPPGGGPFTFTVSGVVKDLSGAPIENAIVAANMQSWPLGDSPNGYVLTNSLGQYSITVNEPGTYYVAAFKEGYQACDAQSFVVSGAGSTTKNLTLACAAVNLAREPGVIVDITSPDPAFPATNAIDGNMTTRANTLNGGTVWPAQFTIEFPAPVKVNEIDLYWENAYAGQYAVEWFDPGLGDYAPLYVTCKGTGGYDLGSARHIDPIKFAEVETLRFRITAYAQGPFPLISLWEVEVHSSERFTGTVAGVVRDTAGNPIPDAFVGGTGPGGSPLSTIQTGADGSFSIAGEAPGSLTLWADAAGFARRNFAPIAVNPCVTTNADLVLIPAEESTGGYNWDFEIPGDTNTGAAGWEIHFYTSGTYARVTTENHTPGGTASMNVHPNPPDWWCAIRNTIEYWPAVDPSAQYCMWYYAKNNTHGGSFIRVDWYDSTKTTILRTDASLVVDEPLDWTRLTVLSNVTPPPGAAFARIRWYHSDTAANAFFDDLKWDVYTPTVAGNSIWAVRNAGDGAAVSLTSKVVTAVGGNLPGGVIYIEEPDRSSGIRVEGVLSAVNVGDKIDVSGTVGTTAGGERKINATGISTAPGTPLGTVGSNNRSLKEPKMGGLYVRAWGKKDPAGPIPGSATIDDGAGPIPVIGALPAGDYVTFNAVVSYDNGVVLIVVP